MSATADLPGGLVLVIDDQPMNLRLLSLLLTAAGYSVALSLSGAEGLVLARTLHPDVVLLDLRMPGMDGLEVLIGLRGEDGPTAIPVIVLTADTDRASLEQAYALGATDFVTKPFVAQELLARVRTHADLKQSRDALRQMDEDHQAASQVFAHGLRTHFANIMLASELQRALPQGSLGFLRLASEIRSAADAGLLSVQASLDEHAARTVDDALVARALVDGALVDGALVDGAPVDGALDDDLPVAPDAAP